MTLSEIPAEILSIATLLSRRCAPRVHWSCRTRLFFRWLDHLHYAVVRARDGVRVQYPLAPEVTVLYPREVEYGAHGVGDGSRDPQAELDPNEGLFLWRCTWSTRNLRRRTCLRHSA